MEGKKLARKFNQFCLEREEEMKNETKSRTSTWERERNWKERCWGERSPV